LTVKIFDAKIEPFKCSVNWTNFFEHFVRETVFWWEGWRNESEL